MLFLTTFNSASQNIGVGLEKQAADFYFDFTQRRVVRYSCFDFFPAQNEGIFWAMKYLIISKISNKSPSATYVYVEIHKMLNFPSICSEG